MSTIHLTNGDVAADSGLNVTSHENIEAITDPEGNAWYDSSGQEIGDKCAWNFGSTLGGGSGSEYNEQISSGNYWLQQEWSNDANGAGKNGVVLNGQISFEGSIGGGVSGRGEWVVSAP